MALATSTLNRGIPCDLGCPGVAGATLAAALDDFRAYRDDCQRYGNEWRDAYLSVTLTSRRGVDERIYAFGPRGGGRRED